MTPKESKGLLTGIVNDDDMLIRRIVEAKFEAMYRIKVEQSKKKTLVEAAGL